jgi:hypothetical protein
MTNQRSMAVALLAAWALCGCATNNSPAPSPAKSACNINTGSRLPAGGCASPSRTYTQDDLNRTGQTTAAGALGQLDPTVTITR